MTETKAETRATSEWRVVCGNFGTRGHTSHSWVKKDPAKAKQSVIDLNHRAEMHPTSYYVSEAPYVVQERTVSTWEETA